VRGFIRTGCDHRLLDLPFRFARRTLGPPPFSSMNATPTPSMACLMAARLLIVGRRRPSQSREWCSSRDAREKQALPGWNSRESGLLGVDYYVHHADSGVNPSRYPIGGALQALSRRCPPFRRRPDHGPLRQSRQHARSRRARRRDMAAGERRCQAQARLVLGADNGYFGQRRTPAALPGIVSAGRFA
jgi:hypothetical protein